MKRLQDGLDEGPEAFSRLSVSPGLEGVRQGQDYIALLHDALVLIRHSDDQPGFLEVIYQGRVIGQVIDIGYEDDARPPAFKPPG